MNSLMQQLAGDPELMALFMRPGLMAKVMRLTQNPHDAEALADPDVQAVMRKIQSLGLGNSDLAALAGGMGGGGLGGGGGSFSSGGGGGGGGAATPGADGLVHMRAGGLVADFDRVLAAAGDRLVVVDFFTTWCGPCTRVAPTFAALAGEYAGRAVFVKVDCDACPSIAQAQQVQAYPTFHAFIRGSRVDSLTGGDPERLRSLVANHAPASAADQAAAAAAAAAERSPYAHFPLKEAQRVSFRKVNLDIVHKKLVEINASFDDDVVGGDGAYKMQAADVAALATLVANLKDVYNQHRQTLDAAQLSAVERLLGWPLANINNVLNLAGQVVLHQHAAATCAADASFFLPALLALAARIIAEPAPPAPTAGEKAKPPTTVILLLRLFCNCFGRAPLARRMAAADVAERVLDACADCVKAHGANTTVRTSALSVFINYALFFRSAQLRKTGGGGGAGGGDDGDDFVEAKTHCVSILCAFLDTELGAAGGPSADTVYRVCVALGTIVFRDAAVAEVAGALDAPDLVERAATTMRACIAADDAAGKEKQPAAAADDPAARRAASERALAACAEVMAALKEAT